MQPRPRVVYWDNLPAPYAVERYNELADRGHLDFSVWFARRSDSDRSWDVDESSWRFHGDYIADPSASVASAHDFLTRCDEVRPDLLLSLYGERSFVVGHPIVKARGIRTAVLALPTFDRWIKRAWWKELLKRVIFRSADVAKVSGPDGHAVASRYGMPGDRIFAVTQSTNLARFSQSLPADERARLRAELGVDGCVFLYVGRFLTTKGLLDLIAAFGELRSRRIDTSLLLVGDGKDEVELRAAASRTEGVSFRPFAQAIELWKIYAAADVFVFPTLGDPHGQVIEEAHTAGLPVITSNAAGDIDRRVTDGVNGYIVNAGDVSQLADRMGAFVTDPLLRCAMGEAGRDRVRGWGHDRWAADFERFVAGALALPPRASVVGHAVSALGAVMTSAISLRMRAHTVVTNARQVGVIPAIRATVLARLNRAGMWLASLAWRATRPSLRLEKCGTKHGGWIVPLDLIPAGGVCYAIGIGCDTSFEDDLLRHTQAHIWSFDPTPSSIAYVANQSLDPSRFTFCPMGVSDKIETARFYEFPGRKFETYSMANLWRTNGYFEAACDTVSGLMGRFGHQSLSLLKISADGSEMRILENLLSEGVRTGVLCVLFGQPSAFWRGARMINRMRAAGFRCVARDEWKFTFVHESALAQRGGPDRQSHAA